MKFSIQHNPMVSVGDFIIYKPKREVLGYSSASTTGHAVPKPRPCCVVEIRDGGVRLAPLVGAKATNSSTWTQRPNSHAEWWHPLEFANLEQVPTTVDTVSGTHRIPARDPIIVEYIHTGDTHMIKPSFIWIGDPGEFVLDKDVPGLRFIGNLHTPMEQIKEMKQWWNYCASQVTSRFFAYGIHNYSH
ncbi:hypothetical protein BDR07DRAFT_1614580 [Suillus spraguei]|nr:hypothetical protein BDR07DRAFT_1614580 [Suillus spraguei]